MDTLGLLVSRDGAADNSTGPPTGMPPMPVFDKDPAPLVISVTWVMLGISAIFLSLRLYCRGIRAKATWWDDWFLLGGWISLLVWTALVTKLQTMGFGRTLLFTPRMHTISTTSDDINKIALGLTKTSFALTMLRVANGWEKWFIWFLIVSMNIVLALGGIISWRPACDRLVFGDAYEFTLPGACWASGDSSIVAVVANGYSAFVDFALALLAIKICLGLQMRQVEKIGVTIAMTLGLFAGVVGIIKCVQIFSVSSGDDIPYRISMLYLWGGAEPNATIIAASIPMIRVLFRDMYQNKYAGQSGDQTGRGGYVRSGQGDKFPRARASNGSTQDKNDALSSRSDRSLVQGKHDAENRILRTREVAVEYNSRRNLDLEDGYEMADKSEPVLDPRGTRAQYSLGAAR